MALAMSGPASRTRSAPSPACFHSPASSCRSRRIFVVPFPEGVERVTRYRSLPTANSSVTAIRGWPWLTSWLTRSPTPSTRPYSAYVMASSNEDFPDPVGPLMANTSRASKSIAAGSRKAVNPLSSSLSGRIPDHPPSESQRCDSLILARLGAHARFEPQSRTALHSADAPPGTVLGRTAAPGQGRGPAARPALAVEPGGPGSAPPRGAGTGPLGSRPGPGGQDRGAHPGGRGRGAAGGPVHRPDVGDAGNAASRHRAGLRLAPPAGAGATDRQRSPPAPAARAGRGPADKGGTGRGADAGPPRSPDPAGDPGAPSSAGLPGRRRGRRLPPGVAGGIGGRGLLRPDP